MRLALLMLLLAGCGGPATWKFDCVSIDVPMDLLERGAMYDYGNIEYSVGIAKALFDGKYGPGEFCARAETVHVELRPRWWNCVSSPTGCQGEWIAIESKVSIVDLGDAFLHEMFHVQDTYEWRLGTLWHQDWDTNGNDLLVNEYHRLYRVWRTAPASEP